MRATPSALRLWGWKFVVFPQREKKPSLVTKNPKGPSNGIVYTFGAEIPTKYLLEWHFGKISAHEQIALQR